MENAENSSTASLFSFCHYVQKWRHGTHHSQIFRLDVTLIMLQHSLSSAVEAIGPWQLYTYISEQSGELLSRLTRVFILHDAFRPASLVNP